MRGTMLLVRAEIIRLRRNRRYMITTLALPIVLYLAIGKSAKAVVYGVDFGAYYMVAMATFGSFSGALTGNAIRIASERKEGWIRQLRLTPLPANGYVVAKLAASMAITIPSVVIVLLLGRYYGGVHLAHGWEWIAIAAVVWLGAMIFTALAIAIGYRFQPDQVQPIAMLIYFLFLIIGGIFFPLSGVLQRIGEYTPTYQAVKIATDVIAGITVPGWLIVGMVVWLAIFSALAWASVRATAESV
ncbi:MAG TPA: ABC transporter permease [Trebonia sp.]|jgi:ABC-2 type transport system permease protein|nr:ABC transporter permease [Trebonia sp.]